MEKRGHIAILHIDRDLDVTCVPELTARIRRVYREGYTRLFLNLTKVGYIDSAAIGMLVSAFRALRKEGGELALINVRPEVYRAMERLRMVDYMPISSLTHDQQKVQKPPRGSVLWRRSFKVDSGSLQSIRSRLSELFGKLPITDEQAFDLLLAAGEALGNAVDHTPDEGITVSVCAYMDRVYVDVSDCGEGFAWPSTQPVECPVANAQEQALTAPLEQPAPAPAAQALPDADIPSGAHFLNDSDIWLERGRGLRLMELLCDVVYVRPKALGTGSVVHLEKLFDDRSTAKR